MMAQTPTSSTLLQLHLRLLRVCVCVCVWTELLANYNNVLRAVAGVIVVARERAFMLKI